ncbi:YbgA family protein [Sphaerisporangium sp. NPDC049003]|uniref:YbgA family protein n=1 Tax=Sphaerisporangium sp. NPDC049003 TaxID=3364517 RepID=UPI00371F4D32
MSGERVRPRVGVSSCLLGAAVRFNGGHSRDRFLSDALADHVDWVPMCPEMDIGLGAPRETLRLEHAPEGPRLLTHKTRRDLTGPMTALAAERAAALRADGYVFKSKSPSCGIHGVPVHNGEAVADRRNRGLFADGIMNAHPLLPVEDEGRLHDDVLREAFVERIFAHARLRELFEGDWRPRDLVAFHSRHKMQLLAHDPYAYRAIGRLVAEAGTCPRDRLAASYRHAFCTALAVRATTGRNVNVLQHCLGMVSGHLDPARRADLVEVIDSYQARHVPLSVPLALLRHHIRGAEATYLRDQTYFFPYPDELRLRNHVPS